MPEYWRSLAGFNSSCIMSAYARSATGRPSMTNTCLFWPHWEHQGQTFGHLRDILWASFWVSIWSSLCVTPGTFCEASETLQTNSSLGISFYAQCVILRRQQYANDPRNPQDIEKMLPIWQTETKYKQSYERHWQILSNTDKTETNIEFLVFQQSSSILTKLVEDCGSFWSQMFLEQAEAFWS